MYLGVNHYISDHFYRAPKEKKAFLLASVCFIFLLIWLQKLVRKNNKAVTHVTKIAVLVVVNLTVVLEDLAAGLQKPHLKDQQ